MAEHLSNRVWILEGRLADLMRSLNALKERMIRAELRPQGNPVGGEGGGGADGAYAFNPSAAMAAASGPPPSGVPTSLASQTIYQFTGGGWSTLGGTATVYNGLPSGVVITKTCWLKRVGADYVVITQSCN